jgi:tetratricopeptide (TPR) repeat protein
LAGCLAALGTFAEAVIYAEEAVRIAEAVDHPYSLIDAYLRLGHVCRHQGDVDNAICAYEPSRALSQDANIPALHINTTFSLGAAYVLSGRVTAAIPLLEQAVEHAMSMPFLPIYSQRLAALSEAYVLAGRMDKAVQLAQQALERARAHQESSDQAGALGLLGEIAARRDPPEVEQAENYYRQAIALAEERGMRPLAAHCRRGLATLYAKSGRQEQAHAELSIAIELYRAMEMTFWLPQAEAALAQIGE